MSDWQKAQAWESEWWNSCLNTMGEETKQLVYAAKMGLEIYSDAYSGFNFDVHGASILDIGGGPVSLLLKCHNRGRCAVLDPCEYPQWVLDRYELAHIVFLQEQAEICNFQSPYDETWMYNCLQHTQDPKQVVEVALHAGKILRVFEWLDTDINIGHLHVLKEETLNEWLGGVGKVETINDRGCVGRAYFGIFKGASYDG